MGGWLVAFALAIWALVSPAPASAHHEHARIALDRSCAIIGPVTAEAALSASRGCARNPAASGDRWVWFRTADGPTLARLPRRFDVILDYSRARRTVVAVALADGRLLRHDAASGAMEGHLTIGGHYRFGFDTGGVRPRAIVVGFDRNIDLAALRKLEARASDDVTRLERTWLLIMGLYVGALGSVLPLPIFFRSSLRGGFELWYALWLSASLAYGVVWSGLVFWVFPEFAGVWSVRANYVLVSMTIGLGLFFLTGFFERWALPPGVRTGVKATGIGVIAAGVLGAADMVVAPAISDLAFNLVALLVPLAVIVALTVALRRHSRAARFYAIAWAAPFSVLVLRLARNFGVATSSDIIDMATFGAVALQCVLLSSAIADIHNRIRRERDAATAERASLVKLAETDPLSGLLNRRGFIERAEAALASNRPVGLFLLDLDHFKRINDGWGHHAGDLVLARLGQTLTRLLDGHGVPGRVGGEEFAVLVTDIADPGALAMCAERVRRAVAAVAMADICPGHPGLTASLGIGVADVAGDFPRLYRAADRALYAAKATGRDRAMFDRREPHIAAVG